MDTSPEIEAKMFEIYRDMPFERKLRIIRDSYRTTRLLCMQPGIRLDTHWHLEDIHRAIRN